MKKKSLAKKVLRPVDVEKLFGEKLSTYVKNKIKKYHLVYSEIDLDQFSSTILFIVKTLLAPFIVYAGSHRFKAWEKGWGENLRLLSREKPSDAVMPRYFGKYSLLRLGGRFIKPESRHFERNSLALIVDWLADTSMRTAKAVYEFGCGTGHHLLSLRAVNPEAQIVGLDWVTASQKIIEKMAQKTRDEKLAAHRFDFFHPDTKYKLAKESVVYTVAALEQTGEKYKPFINYLISNKPKLVIHVEPIAELLDEKNLLDYLSVKYFEKRKYLKGLLNHLRELEQRGKIKVVRAQRTYIGSLFIEGYSVIVWKPL